MPDPRSVMKEFRFLDQKRVAEGLSADEELRYGELRDLVGPEVGTGGARAGFDVSAAAARLRDSLLPAGLRDRPAPPSDLEAELFGRPEPVASSADGLASAVAAAFAPAESEAAIDALFDPASLDEEPAEGAPDAAYAAEPGAWDPEAQPYDPNAAAAWDPNAQPYDPNAPADPYAAEAGAIDPGAAPYDPNAAAAWDPNAQPYDPNAPADPYAAAWDPEAQPYDPNAPPDLYAAEPGAVGAAAAAYDPNATAAWDPNAPADPYTAEAGAIDPGAAPFDPNAAAAWDPNAAAAWDPNAQPYDPDATAEQYGTEAGAIDPGAAAFDPNAAAAWDPEAQPHDPDAPADPYAAEPGAVDAGAAAYDPNAAAAWDPNAQAYDPNAPADPYAAEPGAADAAEAAAWEPSTTGEQYASDPGTAAGATAMDPAAGMQDDGAEIVALEEAGQGDVEPETGAAGWDLDADADPSAEPSLAVLHAQPDGTPDGWDPAPAPPVAEPGIALGEYDEAGGASAPALEAMLSFDAAAGAAIEPGHLPEGYAVQTGEYDDTAGFDGPPPPADADAGAGAPLPAQAPEWPGEEALEQGFQLESGGSFDPSAVLPAWAPAPAAPWEGAAVADAGEEPAFVAAGPDARDAYAEGYDPTARRPLADPAWAGAGAGLTYQGGDLAAPEPEHAPLDPSAPALDFSAPDLTAGAPDDDLAGLELSAPAPQPLAPLAPDTDLPPLELDAPAPAAPPAAPVAADSTEPFDTIEVDFEEIPIIDGEEILEEVTPGDLAPPPALDFDPLPPAAPSAALATDLAPAEAELPLPEPRLEPATAAVAATGASAAGPARAPEAPPAAAPSAAPSPSTIAGVHRVVVHTVEGQVKRGVLEDADLAATALPLAAQPGDAPEPIATEKVKAIFFMLAAGERAPAADGRKVRVTFRDGRQVAGYSPDYREGSVGFFMIPSDTRTNTGRIWVYQAAVRQVVVS